MHNFSIIGKKNQARRGILETAHGKIQTPFFMPIATRGSVKALDNSDFQQLGNEIILSNTYHLYLRPGLEVINQFGGLHQFMQWSKPLLTDSGGYQVFSLNKLRKISESGVIFKSTYDGSEHEFTPEKVVEIEEALNSDIMMVLDECPPYPCTLEYAKASMELTSRWAARCKQVQTKNLLFGIVQGSVFKELRLQSVRELVALNFDGYAIGGLAVGEPAEKMYEILDWVTPGLPVDKPRYLMGVGQPEQILEAVKRGVDMFDCVLPTRNARHGSLYVGLSLASDLSKIDYSVLTIDQAKYALDQSPLDPQCQCATCTSGYTRAYLHHLFKVKEPLALKLATVHNVYLYLDLMKQIRNNIIK